MILYSTFVYHCVWTFLLSVLNINISISNDILNWFFNDKVKLWFYLQNILGYLAYENYRS